MRDRIVDHNLIKILLFPMLSISEILEWSINFSSGVLNLTRLLPYFELYFLPFDMNMSGSS